MLFCTTQFYSMIDAKGCKYVATAGGVATQKLVQKGIDECSVAYINMFGSTETQYISRWIATQPTAPKQIPIGKPVNNVRVYIMLNDRLCGVETIGEICVAGEGLAEGYLNNDELNKQKFEFSKVMGERIYHTGDLGKYLEDGNLMHMGRMDDQVKIRGIRIEISEIENVMAKLDGVTANVITVKQSDKIDKQLCLYFTANRPISVKEAKDHLRKYLPEYMVPAWVMQMSEFPMTRHKKIDKSALPDIANKDNDEIIEPTNKLQRDILNIFKEELNIDKMGINSDFFDFGGHSLKVTNLINKIDNIKNVRLTVSDIFKARTAEKIAKLLEDKCTSAENVFVKAEEKQFYPMSPIQRRLYAVYQADPESLSYNEPVVLESVNDIDAEKLECAFNKMIARHAIFRTVFFYKHGEFVQQISTEYKIKVDTETNHKELDQIVKDFVKPFELEKLPLLRAKVVKQQNRTLILTDMHHIITDRGTVSKMLDELINLYKGKELEPVVWQYKDYSEWINKKDISNQKEFWINEFNDEIPVLSLPYCNNRTKTQSDKGSLASYSISEDIKNKVHNFALEHQITDYMVMLSAFFILLQKRSGQDDIVVGTPISVRTHKDTENIMGMFANTLALRGKPENSKTIKNFINEVKETALSAYQNREYSIDELIDELNSANNSSVNSLFNVMFVMQDSEDKFSKIGGYGLKEIVVSKDTSTFDFVFNILNNSHNGYDLYIEYSTDLFDESFINSLWSGFEHLLEEIPKRYNDRIGDLEIISDEEKNLVLQFMNFMD